MPDAVQIGVCERRHRLVPFPVSDQRPDKSKPKARGPQTSRPSPLKPDLARRGHARKTFSDKLCRLVAKPREPRQNPQTLVANSARPQVLVEHVQGGAVLDLLAKMPKQKSGHTHVSAFEKRLAMMHEIPPERGELVLDHRTQDKAFFWSEQVEVPRGERFHVLQKPVQ